MCSRFARRRRGIPPGEKGGIRREKGEGKGEEKGSELEAERIPLSVRKIRGRRERGKSWRMRKIKCVKLALLVGRGGKKEKKRGEIIFLLALVLNDWKRRGEGKSGKKKGGKEKLFPTVSSRGKRKKNMERREKKKEKRKGKGSKKKKNKVAGPRKNFSVLKKKKKRRKEGGRKI